MGRIGTYTRYTHAKTHRDTKYSTVHAVIERSERVQWRVQMSLVVTVRGQYRMESRRLAKHFHLRTLITFHLPFSD